MTTLGVCRPNGVLQENYWFYFIRRQTKIKENTGNAGLENQGSYIEISYYLNPYISENLHLV